MTDAKDVDLDDVIRRLDEHPMSIGVREARALLARILEVEAERDVLMAECASISEEFDLPPTMRPVEGEIRRMRQTMRECADVADAYRKERDEHRDGRESLRRQVDTMLEVNAEQEAELVRLRAVRDEYKRRALACPACEHRARLELENAKLRPVVKAAKALLQRPNLRDRREALGAALAAAEGETPR